MNIEAKPGSELATRSSYENFVIELAEGMKVDENVFLPKKEGEFDYEDIFSWIRAVDFRNGKPPKIERTIKEDRGIKTLELKTQELDEITDENKKLSSESQLYAMAVTEAKMAVVAELAEDTYPAVRYQINEIRREMQKVRQEIFGVEDKEKSVKEILDRMVRSKKIQAATALVIAAMILTACSNPTQINASETVNPTRPVATEVSPTPATPAETATPAEVETNPEYAEIDQRVRDFLNAEGKYTDEELAKLPHKGFDDVIPLEGNYLGLMRTVSIIGDKGIYYNLTDWSETDFTVANYQAMYLGAVLKDNKALFLMGMTDKQNNRIVVPIGRSVFFEDGDSPVNNFNFSQFDGGVINIRNTGSNAIESNLSDFIDLTKLYGQVVIFDCPVSPIGGIVRDDLESGFGSRSAEKLSEIDNSIPLCKKIFNNSVDLSGLNGQNLTGESDDFVLYGEENYSGVENIIENTDSVLYYNTITIVRP